MIIKFMQRQMRSVHYQKLFFSTSKPEFIEIKGKKYPWFPTNVLELNYLGRLLSAGEELNADHPGFNDIKYRKRRSEIVEISNSHQMSDGLEIPVIEYSKEENELWTVIYDRLVHLHNKHASKEYLESFKILEEGSGMNRMQIPQVRDISSYLKKQSNVFVRPIGGLLSQRDFLYGLAFRVFHSTQYIRHSSDPDYTPEPDIVHEIIGHMPFFACEKHFDIYQKIGLTSLGLNDEDIERLFAVYWYALEFGLVNENGEKKICGGAILSSPQEIRNAAAGKVKYHDFDVYNVSKMPLIITELQPYYVAADSYEQIIENITKYLQTFKRPFDVKYNADSESVEII